MTFKLKNALLAGSAIVAVSALGSGVANAQVLVANTNSGTAPAAVVGGDISMSTFNLTVNNTNNINHGALTATTGTFTITDSTSANLTNTIGSYVATGAAAFSVTGNDAQTANITQTVTGALSTLGNLAVTQIETNSADTMILNVGGAATVGGTVAVTAGAFAGASSATTITGNAAITGTTTLTAGAGAAASANLTLNGASNVLTAAATLNAAAGAGSDAVITLGGASTTFTGGLTLNDDAAAGRANLVLNGTTAQTVTGAINGAAATEGTIVVANAAGATFTGLVGTVQGLRGVTIENGGAALGSSATFQNTVTAPITLGGAGTGTNTVNFDATTQGFTVTGAIAGAIAGETNVVNVSNTSGAARTVTLATASTANIDQVNVSGSLTTLATGVNLTADAMTIGAGSTLSTTANTVTTNTTLANAGTLALNGGSVVATGGITGAGLLDVNSAGTVTGAITQGTADIAAVTLTRGSAAAYTVGTTNFSGAGTLALVGGAQTITGNFTNTTTTATGDGIITVTDVAGTTAFVGNLGDSATDRLASLSVAAGANAVALTTTGNLNVAATSIGQNDTLQFLGTSAQTASGTINGTAGNLGTILVGGTGTNSDVTFSGILGGTNALLNSTVAAGSTARYNANATYGTGSVYTNTGTTVVGQGATVSAESFTDTGSYVLNVVDANGTLAATDFGRITDSNAGSTIAAGKLTINLTGDIGTGTAASVLTGNNTGAGTLADNSIQYTFVAANNAGNTDITVTKATAVSLSDSANAPVATVLDTLTASTNTQIAAIVDNLATARTQSAFNDVLEATGPTQDGGAIVSGFTTSVQSVDVTNTRLASLRNGDESAMVAGEMGNGLTAWIQGFGQQATQDRRDGIDGYDADTYGVAVGLDTANMIKDGTVGVALSYGNTDVESNNANRTKSDVDSYQVSVYGDYDLNDRTYISGTVGYANNNIDQTRSNVGGIAGLNANADYDSQQYIAYAELGRGFEIADKTTLTPKVLTHYQHIAIDDYTETGAGGASLRVQNESLNIFEVGVGTELAWELNDDKGGTLRPALNVGYRHDLVGDEVQSTSNLTGGGASFTTNGIEPAKGTFNAGLGMSYVLPNNLTLSVDYNYDVKSDYDAHAANIRGSYKF